MAELTQPECERTCKPPLSCCSPEYCDIARDFAAAHEVILDNTDHPTLPFMGPEGCTVEPHWRPLCTVHTCEINLGFKRGDPEWTTRYFDLRKQINDSMESESCG